MKFEHKKYFLVGIFLYYVSSHSIFFASESEREKIYRAAEGFDLASESSEKRNSPSAASVGTDLLAHSTTSEDSILRTLASFRRSVEHQVDETDLEKYRAATLEECVCSERELIYRALAKE